MKVFINLTNHPSDRWPQEQLNAVKERFGTEFILDIPFPQINPHATSRDLDKEAAHYAYMIKKLDPVGVLVQGEFTFTHKLVNLLEPAIPCYAATTERKVEEVTKKNGTVEKKTVFKFIKFRRY